MAKADHLLVKFEDSEAADSLWAALLTLDRNREKAELLAAGVPRRSVELLYPHEFADIAPGIVEFTAAEDLRELDGSEEWSAYHDETKTLIRDAPQKVREAAHAGYADFLDSPYMELLYGHFTSELPGRMVEVRADAMVKSLWFAHYFVMHKGETLLAARIMDHFTLTMDWILPDLLRRVTSRDIRERDRPPAI